MKNVSFSFDVYLRFACILLEIEKKRVLFESRMKRNGEGRKKGKRRKKEKSKRGRGEERRTRLGLQKEERG